MQEDIKKLFKNVNLLYVAILGTMSVAAVLGVVFVFKLGALPVFDESEQSLIKSIVIIALLTGIPVSHIFFYKKIKHISPDLSLVKKINMYKVAFIVRVALLEAIGLIAMIGYLVSADNSFLYMFGVVFVLFIIHAPTKAKISSDLSLSEEEEELFL